MTRYPWKLLPRLALQIEHHRPGGAHQDLESLLEITWRQSATDLTLWKLRCSQIASTCVRGALRGGAPSDLSMEEQLQLLRKLSLAKTGPTIRIVMHNYLDLLLERVRPARATSMERAVAQVRQSLRRTLGVSQTLAHYAYTLGVSEGHLSRCFAAISGQSYRSERRRIRLEAARAMLRRSQLKISAIARQLGIADPSQFIADFRREFGFTPAEYRRKASDPARWKASRASSPSPPGKGPP